MNFAKDLETFEHPNLLKVREAGLTQTGKLTIVTEHGDGGNLYYDFIAQKYQQKEELQVPNI